MGSSRLDPIIIMIAWKAKYGYIPYSESLQSISQISFTDDGPFSILSNPINLPIGFEFASRSIAVSQSNNKVYSYDSWNDMASTLEGILGSDYYKIYLMPSATEYKVGDYDILKLHVPSTMLACPNLYNAFTTGSRLKAFVYIPSLNKVIGNSAVYTVNTDGSLTRTYTHPSGTNTYYGPDDCPYARRNTAKYWFGAILLCSNFDGTVDSIVNSNYYCVQFTAAEKNHRLCINKSDKSDNVAQYNYYLALFSDYVPPDFNDSNDPYEPGGNSGEGGGDGTFDDDSDIIGVPPLPTLSAANTGFTRIYNPTLSQVQALARYLWTDETVIETIWNHIKQYFEDPMQAIIGFNLVPVPVPDGGTQNFALMYIDTGVSMTTAASQFVDVDCGTLEIQNYYGSALDYSPYTKIHCFLPYIGMVQLNTDEVTGRTLQVKYRVDIVSGSCVAMIIVDGSVLYQFSGHCAITIPFSSADFSSYVNAAISVAKIAALGAAAGAGVAESAAVADATQETSYVVTRHTTTTRTKRNPQTGRQITSSTVNSVQTTEYPIDTSETKASYGGLTPANIANTAGQVISSKPVIQRSGSFSGNSGYLGVRRPYVVIERPNMCLPENFQSLNGYPSMITLTLGDCTGFTRIQQVQLTGITATNPEQAEILELLKMGVVF